MDIQMDMKKLWTDCDEFLWRGGKNEQFVKFLWWYGLGRDLDTLDSP